MSQKGSQGIVTVSYRLSLITILRVVAVFSPSSQLSLARIAVAEEAAAALFLPSFARSLVRYVVCVFPSYGTEDASTASVAVVARRCLKKTLVREGGRLEEAGLGEGGLAS